MKKAKSYLTICTIFLLLQCQRAENSRSEITYFPNDKFMHIIEEDSITLQWNKPTATDRVISGYKCLYRIHKTGTWIPLNKIITVSDSPWVTIYRKELVSNDSFFDFAVKAIFQDGDSSELNVSTDSLSIPADGWFIKW